MPHSTLQINDDTIRLNSVIEINDSIKAVMNTMTANIDEQGNKH